MILKVDKTVIIGLHWYASGAGGEVHRLMILR